MGLARVNLIRACSGSPYRINQKRDSTKRENLNIPPLPCLPLAIPRGRFERSAWALTLGCSVQPKAPLWVDRWLVGRVEKRTRILTVCENVKRRRVSLQVAVPTRKEEEQESDLRVGLERAVGSKHGETHQFDPSSPV